jgi:hypothetical protein
VERGAGGPPTPDGALLEATSAHGDEGVLSRHKDRIAEYEQKDRPDAQGVTHVALPNRAPILGGLSPSTGQEV